MTTKQPKSEDASKSIEQDETIEDDTEVEGPPLPPQLLEHLKTSDPELAKWLDEQGPSGLKGFSIVAHALAVHAGPLPPPELFEGYKRVDPRIVDEILEAFRGQRLHRQVIEKKIVDSDSRDSLLGLICGLVVTICAFIVAGYIARLGHPWPGGLFGTAALGSLVYTFIMGRKAIEQQRKPSKPHISKDKIQK